MICQYRLFKFFQAIRRLSSNNCKLITDSCIILNQAFTEVEYIEMKEKLKTFQKEQEGKPLNEGIEKLKLCEKDIMTDEIESGRGIYGRTLTCFMYI